MVSFRAIDCYLASVPNFKDLDKSFPLILSNLFIKKITLLGRSDQFLVIVQIDLDLLVLQPVDQLVPQYVREFLF